MEIQAHIQLSSQNNVTKAIIVGDPKRVDTIKPYLTNVTDLAFNREYKSILGMYKEEPILVISTGIGAPSTAIAIEELDNIGIKTIIRVGSCGAMQKEINLGELVISTGTVRDEGLTKKYVPIDYPAIPSLDLLSNAKAIYPTAHFGITRSHDGFYMPDNTETESLWSSFGILGGDMETSTLYVLGSLKKMKTLSILNNVVLYEADLNEGVNSLVNEDSIVATGESNSIKLALELLKGDF
ncbi:nucleoside phosphorylase [Vagococcus fluvialis]|jgi:uridine phosphorylase|uniref:nucleoside phosphorylase n=1 Tax=Vagococcus fluvialis TaxID=2738 RepID=UPI001A8E7DB9|nr:nucleoside phosphorylase [Vagococcus fluvialis]MBO0443058.1 nucleoside phosphorylase [Vagococcus fluvialis]MDR2278410.1 nucleoside phosphorylase [Vagococcus sp.]MDT2747393.1 nucleoside phosphorylase [Vagococcus fluvialis]